MLRVGITGGIGSGKSTVCRIFRVLGVPVFHADAEARRLYEEDPTVRAAMIAEFGESLYASGVLDKRMLALLIFRNEQARRKVNSIVHPLVRQRFDRWCGERAAHAYVVMEAAILVETGGHGAVDALVVVTAPENVRLARVLQRDGATEEEVRARMAAQGTDVERLALADAVIVNDDRALVIPQVLELHTRFKAA
jgi:dephospho-CoA kinase